MNYDLDMPPYIQDIADWLDGTRVHQVGLPYHWGSRGLVTGDVVNDLLAISEEPNVKIFESKGLTCNLMKA